MEWNFDHQMSLSKSKCLYSNNCSHFLKRAVPLTCKSTNTLAYYASVSMTKKKMGHDRRFRPATSSLSTVTALLPTATPMMMLPGYTTAQVITLIYHKP